jgi:TusA-related sulfurtransferase
MATVTTTLDVTGLACPMPVVKTKLAMNKLRSGDVLQVVATDRGSLKDIPAWAGATGNRVLAIDDQVSRITYLIEKG